MTRPLMKVARFDTGQAGYPNDKVIQIVGQGTTQIVTASATQGVSTAFATSTEAIRICGNNAFWYKIGADPTADKAGAASYLPADAVEFVLVDQAGKIACLQDSGDLSGTSQSIVSITELPTE